VSFLEDFEEISPRQDLAERKLSEGLTTASLPKTGESPEEVAVKFARRLYTALLIGAVGCGGGGDPTAPPPEVKPPPVVVPPPTPPPTPPTVSLAGLSAAAKTYVSANMALTGGKVLRWPVGATVTFEVPSSLIGPAADSIAAAWGRRTGLVLVPVVSGGQVALDLTGQGVPPGMCGMGGPSGWEEGLVSRGRMAIRPVCQDARLRVVLSHVLGHALGLLVHTPTTAEGGARDVMNTSPTTTADSPLVVEVARFYYGPPPAPAGAVLSGGS